MARKFLVPLGLASLSSDPAGTSVGEVYFNSTTLQVRIYNGSAWIDLSGGAAQLKIDGGTPGAFYGGTPAVEGGEPSSIFTVSYDGGVS
jgi:hypothetical protein